MTNWHVLRRANWADGRHAIFDYEQDEDGAVRQTEKLELRSEVFFYSNEALDVAVVAVEGTPGSQRGFVDITRSVIPLPNTRLNIIQHPGGGLKRIAIRDNGLRNSDENVIQYWTDTEHGSSGSPVFDDSWEIVGLHFRHDNAPGDSGQTIFYNEGHTMTAIWNDINQKHPNILD